MSKNEQTLDYAPVAQKLRWVPTPAMLAVLGIAFYVFVFAILIVVDADLKSDRGMRVWFALLAVGPPYAVLVLSWAILAARRERRLMALVPSVIAVILMMTIWFSLFSGYFYTRRDRDAARARATRVYPETLESHRRDAGATRVSGRTIRQMQQQTGGQGR